MNTIRIFSVLLLSEVALLCDLATEKVPNPLILSGLGAGLIWQLMENRLGGAAGFLAGASIPTVLLGGLYLFRMIGAGDIKLLAALGGFLGTSGSFRCLILSVLIGGACAGVLVVIRKNFQSRMLYLGRYLGEGRNFPPYLDGVGEDGRFCFTLPVFLAVLILVFDEIRQGILCRGILP